MTFVADYGDPSGLGMFSKAGRFTTEKYIIFQKKEEILNDQRRLLKTSSLPNIRADGFGGKNTNLAEFDDPKAKKVVEYQKKVRTQFDPMSRVVSRDDRERIMNEKHPPPPIGAYMPKDVIISPKSLVLAQYPTREKMKLMSQSSPRKNQVSPKGTQDQMLKREMEKPIPERPPGKIPGYYSIQNQTARAAYYKNGKSPHEERFNYVDHPPISTRTRKVTTIDMNKTQGRVFGDFYKSLEYAPDYEPNYEFGKRKVVTSGPNLERASPRKPYHHISPSSNDNFTDLDKIYKDENSVFANKAKSPIFNRMLSRGEVENTPLPSFMQSINNRMSLGMLSKKTLSTNNFSEGRFKTLYSSFTPQKFT